jgi:hypothetical protein
MVYDLACERCGLPCGLRAVTVRGRLGPCCFDALRDVAPADDPRYAFEQEQRTRERMTKRGGTARHLVRKGIS